MVKRDQVQKRLVHNIGRFIVVHYSKIQIEEVKKHVVYFYIFLGLQLKNIGKFNISSWQFQA
jgi:hypothetical protein